jgi:hypothetical protein
VDGRSGGGGETVNFWDKNSGLTFGSLAETRKQGGLLQRNSSSRARKFCAKNQYFVSKAISNVRQRNLTSYIKMRGRISLMRIFKEIYGFAASIEKQRRSLIRFYFFDAALFKIPLYKSFLAKNRFFHFGHKCIFLTLMAKMKKQITAQTPHIHLLMRFVLLYECFLVVI